MADDPLEERSPQPQPEPTLPPRRSVSVCQALGVDEVLRLEPPRAGPSWIEAILRPDAAGADSKGSAALPDEIGRYRVTGEIGRGGLGIVYQAHDRDLGRDLAIKVLQPSSGGGVEATRRFVEEAQIGGQLQHPGIVPVHELGILDDGRPYFTMKLIKGQTLAALLEKRAAAPEDRQRFLSIFRDLAQTMAYSHARGVIHRDLKPSNILVGAFGELQVVDWGLAKVLPEGGIHDDRRARRRRAGVSAVRTPRAGAGPALSLAGTVMGTPSYMPPEQARGDVDELDERSDVFSLGAVLCEILTGAPPFCGASAEDRIAKAAAGDLAEAFERLNACAADAQLTELCRRCLDAEPRRRPRDAQALAQEMSVYFNSLGERRRTAAIQLAEAQAREDGERRRRRLAAVLAAVVVLGAVGVLAAQAARQAGHARQVAALTAEVERELSRAAEFRGAAEALGGSEGLRARGEALARADRAVELSSSSASAVHLRTRRRAADLRSALAAEHAADALLVQRQERDQEMAAALAALRLRDDGRTGAAFLAARYGSAFEAFQRQRGRPWDLNAPEDAADGLGESAIAVELARGLDAWARTLSDLAAGPGAAPPRSGDREALRAIAARCDPDPTRRGIRAASASANVSELERLLEGLPRRAFDQPGAPPEERQTARAEAANAAAATYDLLAEAFGTLGRPDLALRTLERGVIDHPGSVWLRWELGRLLSGGDAERHPEAVGQLWAAVALRPASARLRIDLARAHMRQGDLELAADAAFDALLRSPANLEAWRLIASLTFRPSAWTVQRSDLAGVRAREAFYRAALERDPGDLRALIELAKTLRLQGKAECVPLLERARRLEPGSAAASRELALWHLERGEAEPALERLVEALTSDSLASFSDSHRQITAILAQDASPGGSTAASCGRLVKLLEPALAETWGVDPATLRVYLLAALRGADAVEKARAASLARRAVDEAPMAEATELKLFLARLEEAAGRRRDAIATLEAMAESSQLEHPAAHLLAKLRSAALPELLSFGSADAALERGQRLVAKDDRWRYLVGAFEPSPGLEWTLVDFDDGSWREDAACFRFGTAQEPRSAAAERDGGGTVLEAMQAAASVLYLRRRFHVADPQRFGALRLAARVDDGAVFYLNGAEAVRLRAGRSGERLPASAVAEVALDENLEAAFVLPASLLVAGENLLAVQALNRASDDEDFHIGLALEGLPLPANDRERLSPLLDGPGGGPTPERLYLDARILERAGRIGEAVERLKAVLASDRSRPEPFLALERCWRATLSPNEALERLEETAAAGPLPIQLSRRRPAAPLALEPAAGAPPLAAPQVTLKTSRFFAWDPRSRHRGTRWQVRAAAGDYVRRPVWDAISEDALTVLTLPEGLFLPGERYFWRAAHVEALGWQSEFGAESALTTGDWTIEAVPFDLSRAFNKDVVADPGDEVNDGVDASPDQPLLPVEGFDSRGAPDARVQGLPADRRVGVHRLGNYAEPNAVQIWRTAAARLRLEAPAGRYVALRFLVVGSFGDTLIPVVLQFADGSRSEGAVAGNILPNVGEWHEHSVRGGAQPIWRGMDFVRGGKLGDYGRGSLFEVLLPCDAKKTLEALELHPERGSFSNDDTTFNLFAVTGMKAGAP